MKNVKERLYSKYRSICEISHNPVTETTEAKHDVTHPKTYTYLNIPISYRKSITRLRLRSNRLQIVRGRYANIPESKRFCQNCHPLYVIEDEAHFMLACPKHSINRKCLFEAVLAKNTILARSTKLMHSQSCGHVYF